VPRWPPLVEELLEQLAEPGAATGVDERVATALMAASGSRSAISRVMRVSRVPSAKTSVGPGPAVRRGVREPQQRVGVALHRAR
jgi:hypothetical protein